MIYKWGSRRPTGVAAQIVGERLEKIKKRNKDALTPTVVVKDARNPESPIHPCFEWDDSVAAEKWRLDQAAEIMRSIVVIQDGESETTEPRHVYIGIGTPDTGSRYATSVEVMSDDDLRSQVIRQTMAQLVGIRKRMDWLNELASVWKAVDQGKRRSASPTMALSDSPPAAPRSP